MFKYALLNVTMENMLWVDNVNNVHQLIFLIKTEFNSQSAKNVNNFLIVELAWLMLLVDKQNSWTIMKVIKIKMDHAPLNVYRTVLNAMVHQ